MSDLTSQLISNTYKQIILVSSSTSNTGVNTSLKAVQTGDGTNTALKVATNAVQITGALGVGGAVSLDGSLHVDDKVCASSFYGDGSNLSGVTATIAGNISVSNATVGGNLYVGGTATVVGAAHLQSSLSVAGAAQFASTVTVSGATQLQSTVTAVGAATFKSTVTVENVAALKNNVTVGGTFNVAGAAGFTSKSTFSNDVSVSGRLDVATSACIGGVLDVEGVANFATNVSVSGNIHVVGNVTAAFYYGDGSNLTNVEAQLGVTTNISVSGYVNIGTSLSVSGTANVVGAGSFQSTVTVVGAGTFKDDVSVSGNTRLLGTVTVGGAVSLASTLSVGGAANFGSTVTVAGAVSLASTLSVGGAANFGSTVTVAGAVSLASTLSVGGAANFASTVTVVGAAHLQSTASIAGNTVLGGTLRVAGATSLEGAVDLNSTLTVAGAVSLASTLSVGGATNLASTVTVVGAGTFKDDVSVSGNVNIGGTVTIGGAVSLASTLSVGGAANFASTVTITGAASVGGAFNVGGNLLVGTTSATTDLAYSPKLKLSGSGPGLYFEETDTSQDYSIAALGSKFYIRDATAVVPRLTIDSSGKVGIGTASPARNLTVNGSIQMASGGVIEAGTTELNTYIAGVQGSSGRWAFATNGSERMRITSSGNVGIGTSSPSTKVEISTNSETSILRLTDTATVGAVNRKVGGIEFYQNDTSGGAGIGSSIEAYHVNISGDTDLRFATGDNSERIRIDSSGLSASNAAGPALLNEAASSSNPTIVPRKTDTATGWGSGGANNMDGIVGGTRSVLFGASITTFYNTSGSEVARINRSNGNVGIGTASPSGILDVEDATVNMFLNSTGTNAGSVLHFQNSGTNRGTVQLGGTGGKSMFFDVVDTAGVMYFRTQSNQTRMTIAAAGGIAMTPTSSGAGQGLSVDASGMANGSNGVLISFASNTGNLISGNAGGAQKFAITHAGALSKTSGSFKIDHPLPSKNATHSLVHSFIEGPQADLIYRGTADLVSGVATVNIDTAAGMTEGTFVVLCTDVQCFTSNEDGWTALKGSVTGNVLTITAQDDSCTDTVSWMVIGERCDPHMLETEWTDAAGKVIVEPLKPEPIEPLEPLELQGGE